MCFFNFLFHNFFNSEEATTTISGGSNFKTTWITTTTTTTISTTTSTKISTTTSTTTSTTISTITSFKKTSIKSTTTSTTTKATTTTKKTCHSHKPEALNNCFEFNFENVRTCICFSINKELTWYDAKNLCENSGTKLADLHILNNLDKVFRFFNDYFKNFKDLTGWVGSRIKCFLYS